MRNKTLSAARNPATGKLQWDADANWPSGLIADFRFFLRDTYTTVINGVSWANVGRTIGTPSGETEKGGRYFYLGNSDPSTDRTDEQRFSFGSMSEFWVKRRIFIPSNFYIRNCISLTISGSIASWQIGDTVRGTDGTSLGEIVFIASQTVYLDYAQNMFIDAIWVGAVTNVTRSQGVTSTAKNYFDNGNKHFVLFCDGYDTNGKSPTIVFGWRGTSKTGDVDLDFSVSVDGFGTGQRPNTQSQAVNFLTAADNGKYLNIIYRVKMATTPARFTE